MTDQEKIYLVGDIRYTEKAETIFNPEETKPAIDFLLALQTLMEEFGVVKIDISTDAYKYVNCKSR